METAKQLEEQADKIIRIVTSSDIPLKGLSFKIALEEIKHKGFYSYTKDSKKILLIQ